jgi:hypothetical protein
VQEQACWSVAVLSELSWERASVQWEHNCSLDAMTMIIDGEVVAGTSPHPDLPRSTAHPGLQCQHHQATLARLILYGSTGACTDDDPRATTRRRQLQQLGKAPSSSPSISTLSDSPLQATPSKVRAAPWYSRYG